MTHHQGGAMTGQPGTYYTVLGVAASDRQLYALRDDGAVFILFKRGDMLPDGRIVRDPHWAAIPAVPGTLAALEQEGKAGGTNG